MNIFKSATKLVFMLMAMSVCAGFFLGLVSDQAFLPLVTMVFMSYYKGKDVITSQPQ